MIDPPTALGVEVGLAGPDHRVQVEHLALGYVVLFIETSSNKHKLRQKLAPCKMFQFGINNAPQKTPFY